MNIKQTTRSSKTTELREKQDAISEEALDRVAGGLNPQPLPPGIVAISSPKVNRFG